tara:strand:+ start:2093 stop:2248 length:156 start_codon:yes stop_codon:yes gene_type:complete
VHEFVAAQKVGQDETGVASPLARGYRQDLSHALRHEDDVAELADDAVKIKR